MAADGEFVLLVETKGAEWPKERSRVEFGQQLFKDFRW